MFNVYLSNIHVFSKFMKRVRVQKTLNSKVCLDIQKCPKIVVSCRACVFHPFQKGPYFLGHWSSLSGRPHFAIVSPCKMLEFWIRQQWVWNTRKFINYFKSASVGVEQGSLATLLKSASLFSLIFTPYFCYFFYRRFCFLLFSRDVYI